MLAALAAASAAGPQATPQGPARIFVYSLRETAAHLWMPVTFDGEIAAEVRRGTFFTIACDPGPHVLIIEQGVPVAVEARPDRPAYVRLDWNYQLGRRPIPVLGVVPARIAEAELRHLSYIEAKKVRSAVVLRSDPRPAEEMRLKTRE
ncbi:MAG: hypothetical protein J0L64_05805 [Acidobacteria bacterium]|nr:hypothetical protein [Acidobacteriota bacterium]